MRNICPTPPTEKRSALRLVGQLGQLPEGQAIEGQAIEGQAIEGQAIEGQAIEGQAIEGQPIEGQPIEGQPIEGQPIEAQQIEAQPSASSKHCPTPLTVKMSALRFVGQLVSTGNVCASVVALRAIGLTGASALRLAAAASVAVHSS